MPYRTAIPDPIRLTLAALTDMGPLRRVNEDACAAFDLARSRRLDPAPTADVFDGDAGFVLLVVDGMGGMSSGTVAARIAVETIERAAFAGLGAGHEAIRHGLGAAMNAASRAIFEAATGKAHLTGIGAVATAAAIVGDRMHLAQVGDTRAYVLREERLVQVTRDHSLINEATALGLSRERIAELPKNVVTRALGLKETVDATLSTIELRAGDTILLCSDGLSGTLGDPRLERILRDLRGASEACRALVDAAVLAGANDNITAIVAQPASPGLRLPTATDQLENENDPRGSA